MKVEVHEHVIGDLQNIHDGLVKEQVRAILQSGFYNISEPSSKYQSLNSFDKSNTAIENNTLEKFLCPLLYLYLFTPYMGV